MSLELFPLHCCETHLLPSSALISPPVVPFNSPRKLVKFNSDGSISRLKTLSRTSSASGKSLAQMLSPSSSVKVESPENFEVQPLEFETPLTTEGSSVGGAIFRNSSANCKTKIGSSSVQFNNIA